MIMQKAMASHSAAHRLRTQQSGIVRIMIESGARIDQTMIDGPSPLHVASDGGKAEICDVAPLVNLATISMGRE